MSGPYNSYTYDNTSVVTVNIDLEKSIFIPFEVVKRTVETRPRHD